MKLYKGLFIFLLYFFLLLLSTAEGYSHTITASAGSGGAIFPSGSVPVDAGNDQAFTITTDPGYTVLDVIVSGKSVGTVSSYTFTNVTADHNIRVFFACYTPQVQLDWDSSLHDTVMEAYDHAVVLGLTDITLQTAGTVIEDLYFDEGLLVSLEGGYDCAFTENYPLTKILGSLTISSDSVTVSRVGLGAPAYCVDGDPINFPGNTETCDGLDNNCNGLADEGLSFDDDGDGYSALGSCAGSANDCNDDDASIHPGAVEIPHDGIDQDCDGQDLVFSEANYCSNCHGAPSTWNALHASVTAPDGTCADCHAVPVSNILPGHYGNTVRTAGNNMEAGAAINCYSCHDDHGVEQPFTPFDGDNIVWAKVAADGRGNVSCDTCHENRAAGHATGTAHDYREIDPTCANCHTSDTSVLGSPGTGTLVSDEDVDILHRSDCNLCHTYSGTKIDPSIVEQAIWDGLYGVQIYCLDCHTDKATGHGVPVSGKHPEHLAMAGVSCNNCHESGNIPYFNSGTDQNGDGMYDLGETDVCVTCHQDGSGNPAPDDYKPGWSDPAFMLACNSCHQAPPPTGTHYTHYSGDEETLAYGDLRITEDFTFGQVSAINIIGCGNCHPIDSPFHGNGTWGDVELANVSAPADSIKALSAGGSYDQITGTCSNVYCHSENDWTTDGPVPIPWPESIGWHEGTDPLPRPLPDNIITTRLYRDVTWDSGETLTCNGCHENPPQTSFVDNDGGAGDSHYWVDDLGANNLHVYNMGNFPPIGCRTCHFDTVQEWDETYDDPNDPGDPDNLVENGGWTTDPATSRRLYYDVAIFDKGKHANGSVDVVFDAVNNFSYTSPVSGLTVTFDLSLSSFEPVMKTCSSVGCHYDETEVTWGLPYRWQDTLECDRCHNYNTPDCTDCHAP